MARTPFFVFLIFVLSASAPLAAETVTGSGATFPAPVYSTWLKHYERAKGTKVKYRAVGSGEGMQDIRGRKVDFGASDAPLLPNDLAKENLIQFPTVVGGVVMSVHVPGVNAGTLRLDAPAVCGIFSGDLALWNDKRIASQNPGVLLPAIRIIPVHRSDESGTTAIFTNYLSKVCPGWPVKVGEGKTVNWPAGASVAGSEGVVQYIKSYPGSIGYVEYAFARQHNLAFTLLQNAAGNYVAPGKESFEDAAMSGMFYQGTTIPKKDFYLWLTNTSGKRAWPITGATFIMVARDRKEASEKAIRFFRWAYEHGNASAEELLYFPLPQALKVNVQMYWAEHGLAAD